MISRWRHVPIAAVVALLVASGTGAWAQDSQSGAAGPAVAAKQDVKESETWRALGVVRPGETHLLGRLSEEQLRAVVGGADPRTIVVEGGKTLAEMIPEDLGDANEDLVFVPLTPCRVIDTRVAGGIFGVNEIRNYDLIGPTDYSSIGGNAAGCGVPGVQGTIVRSNITRALVVNIVAVANQGPGDFRAWPTNQTEPLASVINYALPGQGLNLANGIILQTCNAACIGIGCTVCGTGDLSFHCEGSSSHLVVDVVGYFRAAEDVGQHGAGNRTSALGLTTACQNITSCSVTNPTGSTRTVLVQASVNSRIAHTGGTDDVVNVTVATDGTTCTDPFLGNAASGWAHVDNIVGTSCCFENTISAAGSFSIAANTTATFFVNGRMDPAFNSPGLKSVDSATIQCTLVR